MFVPGAVLTVVAAGVIDLCVFLSVGDTDVVGFSVFINVADADVLRWIADVAGSVTSAFCDGDGSGGAVDVAMESA